MELITFLTVRHSKFKSAGHHNENRNQNTRSVEDKKQNEIKHKENQQSA